MNKDIEKILKEKLPFLSKNSVKFIESLLKEEREEAYKKGFIDGGLKNKM